MHNLETLKSYNSPDKAKLRVIGSAMKSSRFPLFYCLFKERLLYEDDSNFSEPHYFDLLCLKSVLNYFYIKYKDRPTSI